MFVRFSMGYVFLGKVAFFEEFFSFYLLFVLYLIYFLGGNELFRKKIKNLNKISKRFGFRIFIVFFKNYRVFVFVI